jgi:hypothetical protein
MGKIHNYENFLNEEFFNRIFGRKKKVESVKKSNIDSCVDDILKFLEENGVNSWDEFISSRKFDKDVINKMIDHQAKNMNELKEIRFKLKIELSNRKQLQEYLIELESEEEYEKCSQIAKKLGR